MKIFYRASPYLSSNPNPLGENKFEILKICWESFKKVVRPEDEITLINDSLQGAWLDLFGDIKTVEASTNPGTFQKQLDLVAQLEDYEKVLIVEDDYLWQPKALDILEEALDKLTVVFPYDHPGHYFEERFQQPKMIKLIGNHTFREAPSNTLTFSCKAFVVKQQLDLMKSYGIQDHEMFSDLKSKGYDLWCPVPSLATHLVTGLLAPNFDWLQTS